MVSGYRTAFPGSDGVRLSALRWDGDPSLPLMLLVHGLASNARLWDGVAERLAALGHPVLSIDQRGHGESDRPDHGFDFETVANDLATVLDQAASGPAIVAGQSWGGNVVLQLVASHARAVRAALLVDGGFIRLADRFQDWQSAEIALAPPDFSGLTARELTDRSAAMFERFPSAGVQGQMANFEEDGEGGVRPRLSRANHMQILRHLHAHDPDRLAQLVDRPVWILAVRGDDDRRRRVEDFLGHLAAGRLVWADGHHDIHAEQPDVVADILLDLSASTEPLL